MARVSLLALMRMAQNGAMHRLWVLGAGGAARAIIAALHAAGIGEICLTNRTRAREAFRSGAGAVHIGDWEARYLLAAECGLLVNTTSLGMTGAASLDMPLDNLPPGRQSVILFIRRWRPNIGARAQ